MKNVHLGIPDELIPLVRTITDLDSLDQNEKNYLRMFVRICFIFDGNDIDDILASIEEGKGKRRSRYSSFK